MFCRTYSLALLVSIMRFISGCFRRKPVDRAADTETELKRCLSTVDVTVVALGHMIGGGIYVLSGEIAKNIAGPALTLSYILAGLASTFTALCYAEFGSWVPRAGSAYTYAYVTLGEIWAFVVGWNIILEHMIGAAAVARTGSLYIESLTNHWLSNNTGVSLPATCTAGGSNHTVLPACLLAPQVDFTAAAIILLISLVIAIGAKQSVLFNNMFVACNVIVIAFIVGYGLKFADISNWTPWSTFAPFGISAIVAGASKASFAYIGFDSISICAEEMCRPARTIPRATITSLLTVTVVYALMAATLTLAVPLAAISAEAAFAELFKYHGANFAVPVVTVGVLSGIIGATTGHMFALPRIVYSLSVDGLLPKFLSRVNRRTQVPSLSVILCGIFAAFISLFVATEILVDVLAIGTLVAYTIVCLAVLLLRYLPSPIPDAPPGKDLPNRLPLFLATAALVFGTLLSSTLIVRNGSHAFFDVNHPFQSTLCVLGLVTAVAGVLMFHVFKPRHVEQLAFKVPCVPLFPICGVIVNLVLIVYSSYATLLRLFIWMLVGFFVFITYSFWHSEERPGAQAQNEEKTQLGAALEMQISARSVK